MRLIPPGRYPATEFQGVMDEGIAGEWGQIHCVGQRYDGLPSSEVLRTISTRTNEGHLSWVA